MYIAERRWDSQMIPRIGKKIQERERSWTHEGAEGRHVGEGGDKNENSAGAPYQVNPWHTIPKEKKKNKSSNRCQIWLLNAAPKFNRFTFPKAALDFFIGSSFPFSLLELSKNCEKIITWASEATQLRNLAVSVQKIYHLRASFFQSLKFSLDNKKGCPMSSSMLEKSTS